MFLELDGQARKDGREYSSPEVYSEAESPYSVNDSSCSVKDSKTRFVISEWLKRRNVLWFEVE